MTYSSDLTRQLFHSLPTEIQLQYSRLEEALAQLAQMLGVESVQMSERSLEVVIRITRHFDPESLNPPVA